jgi:probable HAF family extracellular repeat protein
MRPGERIEKRIGLHAPIKMLGLIIMAAFVCLTAQAQIRYTIADLGTNGHTDENSLLLPTGINDRAEIVGETWNSYSLAFTWSAGKFLEVADSDYYFTSAATALNDLGQVVGQYSRFGDGGPYQSFIYSGGKTQELIPGNFLSYPEGINNRGQVTGWFTPVYTYESDGILPSNTGPTHAFLYTEGKVKDLGTLGGTYSDGYGVNDLGDVVGISSTVGDKSYDAFLYSNGKMRDLGIPGFQPVRINDLGQIFGNGPGGAAIYSGGKLHYLTSTTSSSITAVSALGQAVGISNGVPFVYLYGKMHALILVSDPGVVIPNASFDRFTAINDFGQIAAYGTVNGDAMTPHLFLLTPTGRLVPGLF